MHRLSCPRRASLVPLAVLVAALAAACGTSQVAPSDAAPSGSAALSGSPGASNGAAPSSSHDSLSSGSAGPSAGATLTPTDDPGGPPPAGDPQEDEACFAVLPAADVGAALGTSVSDVVALGTDPAVSLTCTYTAANGGTFLVTATAGGAATEFQSNLDAAAGYGQNPVAIDGLADQAFYAAAADRWPEQVVFAKGPVLVRLINQTSATIGEATFASLAATAADAIHAEIPPAP